MPNDILKTIADLEKRLRTIEQNMAITNLTLPATGKIVVPVMAADPASPTNGQIWYNSTTGVFKCYENSTIKTFTTS